LALSLLLVEDNDNLRARTADWLEATGGVTVAHACASGEDALAYCLEAGAPDAALLDVQLAGELNGVAAAVALRREFPRFPVVFYSIQDDDAYYRDFRRSGILSHYAYVRKSNYLLPAMIVPLLRDAAAGRSFIDPEIETRVQAVRPQGRAIAVCGAGAQRAGRGAHAGPGADQRADRRALRLPRQAQHQPHQRPDLRGLGPDRNDDRREGRPDSRGPDRTDRADDRLGRRRARRG
jgi:DNA-binding NarL/FixJ family response regulator